MLNLIIYINEQEQYGEKALVNKDTNEIIVQGDYYHNKISSIIDGFILALQTTNKEYTIENIMLSKEECKNLPFALDFYYEEKSNEESINTDFAIDYSCNGMNVKNDEEMVLIENETSQQYQLEIDKPIDDINAFMNYPPLKILTNFRSGGFLP